VIDHSLFLNHISEQPTSPPTWFWTYCLGASPVVEDAPVCRTAARLWPLQR